MRRAWIRRAATGGAILTAVLCLAPGAGAQGGTGEAQQALQRTDELLQMAEEIVRGVDSQRARLVLDQAFAVQRNAWGQFHGRNPRAAVRLTIEARDIGKRAIRLAREDGSLRTRARRELEKAWDTLQRAREQLGDTVGQTARLLDEAHKQIERGRSQFREQNYEPAMRLAISAQRLVRQALGSSDAAGGEDRLERELERTDRLLERAREAIAGSDLPEARRALERATSLQRDAWAAFRAERFRVALAATREARNLAARVLRLLTGPVSAERVERALSETDRLLDRAADVVEDASDETAARLVERARDHQAEARRLLADDQLRPALAKTRVAAGLAKRALRLVEGGGGL